MELACQWLLASADDFESEPETDNSSPRNESSEITTEDGAVLPGIQYSGGQDEGGSGSSGERPDSRGDSLQDARWLTLRSLASNPTLQQERLMHAFQAMIENPREARSYLTDPEIGPILLQVQRAQRVSSGITPEVPTGNGSSNSPSSNGAAEDSQATNEDEE